METTAATEFIMAFVVPQKRERYAGFLQSPKRRLRFLRELYHFSDFDPESILPISGACDTAEGLLSELRKRGAPATCQIISVRPDLDGAMKKLSETIHEVFAVAEGTIVICIPGRLAYYEGEAPKNRFILARSGR